MNINLNILLFPIFSEEMINFINFTQLVIPSNDKLLLILTFEFFMHLLNLFIQIGISLKKKLINNENN